VSRLGNPIGAVQIMLPNPVLPVFADSLAGWWRCLINSHSKEPGYSWRNMFFGQPICKTPFRAL
jgi:hypothetical protein